MQMARLLLQAHEKTPAGKIRRGFCMKAQDADFFLRALPNGSRMKNSDLVCCFAFWNCYIYEVSKKRRNRRMKQEQVLVSSLSGSSERDGVSKAPARKSVFPRNCLSHAGFFCKTGNPDSIEFCNEVSGMTYKTIVIDYAPKAKKMAAALRILQMKRRRTAGSW